MLKRINRYNALQYMLLQSNTHKFRDTYLSCFHQGHCWNVTVSRISWHPRNDCKKDLTLKRSSCLYNLWQMLYLSVTKLFNMLLTCLLYYELFSLVKQGVVFPRTACCIKTKKWLQNKLRILASPLRISFCCLNALQFVSLYSSKRFVIFFFRNLNHFGRNWNCVPPFW